MTEREIQGNYTRSKTRSRVEHVFGVQAQRAGNLLIRTIGAVRAKAKIGLRNLAYNLDRYTRYLKAQVKELLVNYGPLVTIWYDVPQEFDTVRGQGVIDFTRSLQPNIVINNRTGAKGDYSTPEQRTH